ncbi:hypothetical protein B0H67DRAFT_485800, partial [Lasiosphaeris hirsuta]
DLLESLLGEVELWVGKKLGVAFWKISRDLNTVTDAATKSVADNPPVEPFRDLVLHSSVPPLKMTILHSARYNSTWKSKDSGLTGGSRTSSPTSNTQTRHRQ